MKSWLRNGLPLAVLTLSVCPFPAFAGTPLSVIVDKTQLIQLSADAGTIVIGNPSIVDVSLNGRQAYVNGHSYGETNIMIFDNGGSKIADFDVTVGRGSANQLSMYMGNAADGVSRYTYSCDPDCEINMMVGDNNTYLGKTIAANRSKNDFAQGVKTTDLAPRSINLGASSGGTPAQ